MKEQLLQLKQDILDISNDLTANLADKGVEATGTLSELVNQVKDIKGGGNPLEEIGWNLSEQPNLQDAINYAKEIQANPKISYRYDTRLVIFPKVDELVCTKNMFERSGLTLFPDGVKLKGELSGAFQYTGVPYLDLSKSELRGSLYQFLYNNAVLKYLILPDDFGVGVTNVGYFLGFCDTFSGSIKIDCTDIENMSNFLYSTTVKSVTITGTPKENLNTDSMLYGSAQLTSLTIPDKFPSTNYGILYSTKLERVDGSFVYKGKHSNSTSDWFFAYSANKTLRYLVVKDIGIRSTDTILNTSYGNVWGINSDSVPDARQSLIDSLITYSYDRASAGYSTMSITLHKDVKALLTEDEIAQITAKGYTLI